MPRGRSAPLPRVRPPATDVDEDGLDDGFEDALVRANLPFLAHHPDDECPPAGLVALVAISHQGTPCERTTTCGTCKGLPACDLVDERPTLYASRNKHAGVVDIGGGCAFGSCLDSCALPLASADVPLVNAGEPGHPLVDDLTTRGFIDDNWPDELQHRDPWGGAPFGTAGVIADDLLDELLVTPACTCE